MATSTGNNRGGASMLYVAVTDEHRVLRIDLREPGAVPSTRPRSSRTTYGRA